MKLELVVPKHLEGSKERELTAYDWRAVKPSSPAGRKLSQEGFIPDDGGMSKQIKRNAFTMCFSNLEDLFMYLNAEYVTLSESDFLEVSYALRSWKENEAISSLADDDPAPVVDPVPLEEPPRD